MAPTGVKARSASSAKAARRAAPTAGALARAKSFASRRPALSYGLAFLLLLGLITALRWSVIDSPPYYDFATGVFVEASYLADSNFDYARLARDEVRWLEGGPAVYITSAIPTLVAVLMKGLPSARAVLIAYHLFNFACAAAAGLLMFAILQRRIGALGAALMAALMLTAPLFSAQIDMLGMDLPMTVFALATLWLVAREQYLWAALTGAATFFVKSPGRAVSHAVAIYLVLLLVLGQRQPAATRRRLWIGLGANLLVVALQDFLATWVSELPNSDVENWSFSKQLFGEENMLRWTPQWFPDQVAIFLLSLVACAAVTAWWLFSQRRRGWAAIADACYGQLVEFAPYVVGWIIALGVLAALALVYCLPRYFLLMLPPVYLALGQLLFWRPRWRGAAAMLVAALVLFNLANAYGRFYPKLTDAQRTGAVWERSRECLLDHASNIRAVEALLRERRGAAVVAASPFVQFLAYPRLGYVDQAIDGYTLNRYSGPHFVSGLRLPDDNPAEVVFVYVDNPFSQGVILPPQPEDEIIYHDHFASPLIVYRRRWPATMGLEERRLAYERLVLPEKALVAQGNQLAQVGAYREAIDFYRRAAATSQFDAEAQYGWGFALVKLGERAEAIARLEAVVQHDAQHAGARALLGATLAETGRYAEGLAQLQQAAQLAPTDPQPWITIGKIQQVQGQWRAAIEALTRGAELALAAQQRERAVATVELALSLAQAHGETSLLPGLEALAARCRATNSMTPPPP